MSEILLARAGEEILCPECREVLATIGSDWLAGEGLEVRLERGVWENARRTAICCPCGGQPTRPLGPNRDLKSTHNARIFLRSGSWVGWRGLGE